ncbi:MAG: hypothetical protein WAU57_04920 [Xanthobacteraceae bacterium]
MTSSDVIRQINGVVNRERIASYLRGISIGSGVRIGGLATQLLVLVILSRIMPKGSFGDMMTAFGFYRLAATALGVGPSLVLFFHISRHPEDRVLEVKLHRYSALLGAAASLALAIASFATAGTIADIFDKPGLEYWFRALAPLAVFGTLLIIATGALEGRSRVSDSILFGDVVPSALRLVGLAVIALFDLPVDSIAYVLTLSVAAPWLWAARRLWQPSISGVLRWSAWDYRYCGKFGISTLFAYQLNATDVLVASALFSSEAVADYVIAARIAAMFSFLQIVVLKWFSPRAGSLLPIGDLGALRREVELCSALTISCCCLTIAGILCVTPLLLPLFGDYARSLSLVVWLALPTFVQSFYSTSDRLLVISGNANVALILTASSFLTLILVPIATADRFGLTSIPLAMLLAMIVFQPIVAVRVKAMFDIRTIGPVEAAAIILGCVALVVYALKYTPLTDAIGCFAMSAVAMYYIATAAKQRLG